MSKQFRFYLVPSDIEHMLVEIRNRFGAKLIAAQSDTHQPTEIDSPFRTFPARRALKEFTSVNCYFVPPSGANIKMWYAPKLKKWLVKDEGAEVIEFSGCNYDGSLLGIGRLYFKTDMLIDDTIWPQRKKFTDWANNVFRATKKLMRYSNALEAYIGKDAYQWRRNGGRFVSGFKQDGTPIFEQDERLLVN